MRKASSTLFLFLLSFVCCVVTAKKQDELVVVAESKSWFTSVSQLVVSPWNLMMAFMVSLPDILKSFDLLFSKLQELSTSVLENVFNVFKSTARKSQEAQERYTAIDGTVKELTRLRQSMEAACLYPRDATARSLCVEREMDITGKLQRARRQRQVWQRRLERLQRKV